MRHRKPFSVSLLEKCFIVILVGVPMLLLSYNLNTLGFVIVAIWFIFFMITASRLLDGDVLSYRIWVLAVVIQVLFDGFLFLGSVIYSFRSYSPFALNALYPSPPYPTLAPTPSSIITSLFTYIFGGYENYFTNGIFMYALNLLFDTMFGYLLLCSDTKRYLIDVKKEQVTSK